MEQILLDCYLKYMKENHENLWKKLIRAPWYIILIVVLLFLSLVSTLVVDILAVRYVFIPELISIILTIILYTVTEKYTINRSGIRYQKYVETCTDIKEWLKSINIASSDSIALIVTRMNDSLEKERQKEKDRSARADKWMQVLIIPVVLAIISAVIGKQSDISAMLSYVFSILFIVVFFYGFFQLIRSVLGFPQKRRTEQLQCFVDDLKSIQNLDSIAEFKKKESATKSEET